jgi:hypothetical protein
MGLLFKIEPGQSCIKMTKFLWIVFSLLINNLKECVALSSFTQPLGISGKFNEL